MNAPDKIYIEQKAVMYDMVNTEPCKPDDYEFIRKDALLDFLNERRKVLTSGESFVAGERKMLREIIEKIELL